MVSREQTFVAEAEEWAARQLEAVDLGDERLERRAVEIGTRMARLPAGSLPQQVPDDAELKAAYRFFDNPKVSHVALSQPHWERTRQQATEAPVTLFIQDVTELDYTRYAETMVGVAPIGDGKGRGLLLHTTLAVNPQPRRVLGIAHQQVFKRKPNDEKPRRQRPKAERESRVWGEAVRAIGRPPEGACWVIVADRSGDNTDFLCACRDQGFEFNVRLAYKSRMAMDGQQKSSLFSVARSWEPVVGKTISIRERSGRPARQAHLLVSFGRVTLKVPKKRAPLQPWIVRVWEIDAPADSEPLEWILASSLPVTVADEALERVQWYTARWLVEDYHQCLKTGCAIEQRDFEHVQRIERLLGFLAVVAVRLLQMREETRLNPDLPADTLIDPMTVSVVAAQIGVPASGMTIRTFWHAVAKFGGFVGRRRSAEPGWKVLWRGWLYVETLVQGARLALSHSLALTYG